MEKNRSSIERHAVLRRGRSGWRLANDQVALCCLRGGGHIQSFSRRSGAGKDVNLLWEPPWQTIEPWRYSKQKHGRQYGFPPLGKYLSGYTGHSLCIDYFGAPSEEEARLGLPLHGEVASNRWSLVEKAPDAASGYLEYAARHRAPDSSVQRDIRAAGKRIRRLRHRNGYEQEKPRSIFSVRAAHNVWSAISASG